MHSQRLPPDILSNLPDNIIDVILMCLSCKDAVRTSILSKKWRYIWCRRTEFELDESHLESSEDLPVSTVNFTKIIDQILTFHEGPITKFTLDILKSCPNIDNFINFVSVNGIQHLVLHFPPLEKPYELPSSFFTCSSLRHLSLHECIIHPPSSFKGFDRLISLELCSVPIRPVLLEILISHCSLLEQLVLDFSEVSGTIEINAPGLRSFHFTGDVRSIRLRNVPLLANLSLISSGDLPEEGNFDITKFFAPCSSLEHLLLNFFEGEVGDGEPDEAPTRLPIALNRVKRFYLLDFVLLNSYGLSCVLCLLRSVPYLEYLEIQFYSEDVDDAIESLELERFSDVTFHHLKEVKLVYFTTTTPEMQLVKLLLAKSPVLAKMLISPCIYDERLDAALSEISKFRHASSEAEVVYLSSSEAKAADQNVLLPIII